MTRSRSSREQERATRELLAFAISAHKREIARSADHFTFVPIDVRTKLLDPPPELVTSLIAVAQSWRGWSDDEVARAIDLLVALEARQALPAFLELAVRDVSAYDIIVHEALGHAFVAWDALGDIFRFAAAHDAPLGELPFIVAVHHEGDERVFAWLLSELSRDAENVAIALRCLKDKRATPHLLAALDRIDRLHPRWRRQVYEIVAALDWMGHALSPEHRFLAEEAGSGVACPWADDEARDATTSTPRLRELARHRDPRVRVEVAENPRAPKDVLRALVCDPDHEVRAVIAKRSELELVDLERLAGDEDERVRSEVAERQGLPWHLVERLSIDDDEDTRAANVRHLPPERLAVAAEDPSATVRGAVAGRADLPLPVMQILAHDPSPHVRYSLVSRTLPRELLRALACDRDELVRARAREHLDGADRPLLLVRDADDPVPPESLN